MEKGCLLGDLTKQGVSLLTILSFSGFGFFVAPGHFGLVAGFTCRANFNRCILKGCSRNGHLTATLENELYNFCMHKSMDRLSINMCDEISLSQSSLMSRSPILYVPNHVVHSINVCVSHVNPDGTQGETIFLAGSVDDYGGFDTGDSWGQVSAG